MLLLTGATGFIGRAVRTELTRRGIAYRAAVRRPTELPNAEIVVVGDINAATDWTAVFGDGAIDAVIHIAGLAHVTRSTPEHERQADEVNHLGTAALAGAAANAGCRRFVLLSSVKVHGESTPNGPFHESDTPHPADAYARSKLAAEQALVTACTASRMEHTIVRTPLVYGPDVRANYLALLRLVDRGLPLPLGATHNARSMIYVDNLAHALVHCSAAPAAAGQMFLVKDDGPDLSTVELIRRLAVALGRPAHLVPVPMSLLRAMATVVGKRGLIDRLAGSLTVDASRIRDRTGWTAPVSVDEALARTAEWYRQSGAGNA